MDISLLVLFELKDSKVTEVSLITNSLRTLDEINSHTSSDILVEV